MVHCINVLNLSIVNNEDWELLYELFIADNYTLFVFILFTMYCQFFLNVYKLVVFFNLPVYLYQWMIVENGSTFIFTSSNFLTNILYRLHICNQSTNNIHSNFSPFRGGVPTQTKRVLVKSQQICNRWIVDNNILCLKNQFQTLLILKDFGFFSVV